MVRPLPQTGKNIRSTKLQNSCRVSLSHNRASILILPGGATPMLVVKKILQQDEWYDRFEQ
jgi:hypothetical protein